jgi:2-polyprenyl-6-methoxyphenol hydroxylase-like FAD-dependent oxidoreductase
LIYDVLIAGAGPVGLFLACELRLGGLSILVLEQAEDPRSPLKRLPFGMRGLSAPTIEAFYRRGLLDDVAAPQRASAPPAAHWIRARSSSVWLGVLGWRGRFCAKTLAHTHAIH